MDVSIGTLVLVPAIAVAAPLLVRGLARWVAIPLVVFEILLGLLLGPAVLGWIVPDDFVQFLSEFGLAMLFFVAGNEIDFAAIRGRPITRAAIGWIISLVVAFSIAVTFAIHPSAAVFIAIALTSTALGTIMPVLRDSGDLKTPFGVAVIALGAVGEFGPLLAISIFLGGRSPLIGALVLAAFALVAAGAIWMAARGVGRRMHRIITATLHTSGQFAVRLVVLVLVALVALSVILDLDMLLGAFTAGVLYRLLLSGAPRPDVEIVEGTIEALGYGFLVPIFFIYTGVTFVLAALFANPWTIALLALGVVMLLVVRGLPSLLAAPPGSSRRDLVATAFFGATGLPIIVAVTAIGVDQGDLPSGTAAALVGAGMLSVLAFPLVAWTVRGRAPADGARSDDEDVEVPTEG